MHNKITIKSLSELPTMPATIGFMLWNQTGDWRYLTPIVKNKQAPCSQNCPLGISIPDYLSAVENGNLETGLALLLAHNPLPGLTGRLCYHPCQGKCVRKKIDRAISIQQLERFIADYGAEAKIKINVKTDKRVVVIGSGPLGLSCAFYLGCQGCQVVVLDPCNQAGGALVNISPGKIESKVLAREINRLIRLADIKLETGYVINLDDPDEVVSKADLIILDSTGLSDNFSLPASTVAFNPFNDEILTGHIILAKLSQDLKPFKAPMIAHYIAAGRLMAQKAFDCLVPRPGQQGPAKPNSSMSCRAVNVEDIKIERFLASDLAAEGKAKQEGTWDLERAQREAEGCLSCGTCTLCLQCVSFCPDASIRLDEEKREVMVDLDHCKGCGICAYECPRGVITMEEVSQ
jgi:Pyruvate/2-oxoacid:ferredoxin oxidoreductase delta subunit